MDLKGFKIKKPIKQDNLSSFQDYALEVIEEFGIKGIYKQIIFKHAKQNKAYLEGRVTLCYEKFGKKNLKNKGHYLISLFRKKKPWDK